MKLFFELVRWLLGAAWKHKKIAAYILGGLAVVALAWWAVATVRGWQEQAAKVPGLELQLKNQQEDADFADMISTRLEKTMAAAFKKAMKTQGEIRRETSSDDVYRNCMLPASGLQLYRDSVEAAPAR